jgi:hypothetical protein
MHTFLLRAFALRCYFAPESGGGGGGGGNEGAVEEEDPDPNGGKPTEPDHKAEAEKWKALARKHESQSKANADAATKLKELEDKDKTETQRLNDELIAARAESTSAGLAALRLEIALDKAPDGMSAKDVAKYAKRLHGTTREELEADADEFFEDFEAPTGPDGKKPPARKPNEKLRSAADAEDKAPEAHDVKKTIASLPRL